MFYKTSISFIQNSSPFLIVIIIKVKKYGKKPKAIKTLDSTNYDVIVYHKVWCKNRIIARVVNYDE